MNGFVSSDEIPGFRFPSLGVRLQCNPCFYEGGKYRRLLKVSPVEGLNRPYRRVVFSISSRMKINQGTLDNRPRNLLHLYNEEKI